MPQWGMMGAMGWPPPVVVPAAGLGSRLRGVIDVDKELAVVGGQPVLWGALLEIAAAGAPPTVIVTSPTKPLIRATAEELLERDAVAGLEVTFVEQPEPRGVFDAVARAAAVLGTGRVAVLFPDFIHLPDQTGLKQVLEAPGVRELDRRTVYGAYIRTPERASRMGGSARFDGIAPVHGVGRVADDGTLHSGLVEVRGTEFVRRAEGLADGSVLELLRGLAADELLDAWPLDELLDVGVPAGYRDAVERFADGRAAWRAT